MTAGGMIGSIGRGFGSVARFSGRDTPGQYWPYVLFLYLIVTVASTAVIAPPMVHAFSTMFERMRAMPRDQIDHVALQAEMTRSMMRDMQGGQLLLGVINIVWLALGSAATVRRLHDRDWSGWWIMLPIASSIATLLIGQYIFAAMAEKGADLVRLSQYSNIVSWVGLGAYIILFIQLVQRGDAGPNRYGFANDGENPFT